MENKLSFKYDVESHIIIHTVCFTRLTLNWQSLANHAMLRMFKAFLTLIGTVQFLICSEIWLYFNQWRTIKLVELCRKIH